jgi:hypothetical protein
VQPLNADHRHRVREECRVETARSGLVAAADLQAARAVAGIAGMGRHTAAGSGAAPEVGEVAVGRLLVVVAVAAASSGRPEATVPTLPSLLAAVLAPLREQGPRAEHMASVPRMQLQREAEVVVRKLLPAAESSSTAEAIQQRRCSRKS